MKSSRKRERPRVAPAPAAVRSPSPLVSREIWRRRALPILALWAFALLVYSNSFRAGFVFDNNSAILRDSRVHAVTSQNLHLILTEEYWYKTTTTLLYRPLTTFSYLLNYAILDNGLHPAGYHWVNFALHAVNIALVYLLGLLLFQETGRSRYRDGTRALPGGDLSRNAQLQRSAPAVPARPQAKRRGKA